MDGDFDRDVLAAADMSPRNLEGEFAESCRANPESANESDRISRSCPLATGDPTSIPPRRG
jgi:hypothetical protein